jgi:hypothetical protein
MDTKTVETVAMYGPSISDPSKIVNRDVPECDVQAYKAAGYAFGTVQEPPCYTLEDAIAQNDGVDVTAEKVKAKRGSK